MSELIKISAALITACSALFSLSASTSAPQCRSCASGGFCISGSCTNGRGMYTWPGGFTFLGNFKNGIIEGRGIYAWPDGKIYDGQWEQGMRSGNGTITYPDGSRYAGQWKEDRPEGEGILYDHLGRIIFRGTFREGKPDK